MNYNIGDTEFDSSNWEIRDGGCGRNCDVTIYYDRERKNLIHVQSRDEKDERGSWTGKFLKKIINIVPWPS